LDIIGNILWLSWMLLSLKTLQLLCFMWNGATVDVYAVLVVPVIGEVRLILPSLNGTVVNTVNLHHCCSPQMTLSVSMWHGRGMHSVDILLVGTKGLGGWAAYPVPSVAPNTIAHPSVSCISRSCHLICHYSFHWTEKCQWCWRWNNQVRMIMVALCNRADHYIFILFLSFFFFLLFFSSPNLSSRRLYVYHTLAHGVALVRI